MKLASRRKGRDGELLVVTRDLTRAIAAPSIAPTLQAALDDWASVAAALDGLQRELEADPRMQGSFDFDPAACSSPLPRAYQWADGSAYLHHVELVRRARGAEMPESFRRDPLMYQGGSDGFLDPHADIAGDPRWGIDFEAEVCVVVGDVPMGCTATDARAHVKLVMLVNDVSLRALVPGELAKGFGFFQSKPASAFSPVAVTPDELGRHWRDGKLHLPLLSFFNEREFGSPQAGEDMAFDFGQLIAHAARTRRLGAGTIVGSGTVSNRQAGRGYSCIAELRMVETLRDGQPSTGFMQDGDRIRIEMRDDQGRSIFGAIDQRVRAIVENQPSGSLP
ncbi:MAG: MhpD [Panacagrimonas sp.]|jgi:fumarylacetoacetate (FAA) hydrolase|nr:fumarylacetoacetate hydrolase family protein [Panacagrimonas sp.]MCC2655154.1 MhpD [Panacagrimonas sp.]